MTERRQDMHTFLIFPPLLPTRRSISGPFIFLPCNILIASSLDCCVNYFSHPSFHTTAAAHQPTVPPPSASSSSSSPSFISASIMTSRRSFFCGKALVLKDVAPSSSSLPAVSSVSLSTLHVQGALKSVCQQQRQMVWKLTGPCEVTEGMRRFSLLVYSRTNWHVG